MIQISEEHTILLTTMATQGTSHFVVVHPTKTDPEDEAKSMKKRLKDSKALVKAGLIEDVSKEFKKQINEAEEKVGRGYSIFKITDQAKILFGTCFSRSIN